LTGGCTEPRDQAADSIPLRFGSEDKLEPLLFPVGMGEAGLDFQCNSLIGKGYDPTVIRRKRLCSFQLHPLLADLATSTRDGQAVNTKANRKIDGVPGYPIVEFLHGRLFCRKYSVLQRQDIDGTLSAL